MPFHEEAEFSASAAEGSHRPAPSASPSRRPSRDAALPAEIAFLREAGLDPSVLAQATHEARALGVTPDAALLAGRHLAEDDFCCALARHCRLPSLTRGAALAPGLDYASAAKAGIAPLQRWPGGPRWIVAPRGAAIASLPSGSTAARWC